MSSLSIGSHGQASEARAIMSCHQWNWVPSMRLASPANRWLGASWPVRLQHHDVIDDVPVIGELADASSTFFCSGTTSPRRNRRRR
jgi:hypothetical protein